MALVQPQNSTMEQLPTEVLSRLLDFLTIPSRIQLARGNTTLQQRVYRECPLAWETMNFVSSLSYDQRFSFGDLQLSTLLTRVNAIEVTKNLNLTSCLAIRGSGLFPLQGSRVLESVELRHTSIGKNPAPSLSFLQTCIPYKLVHVSLDDDSLRSDNAKDFMHLFSSSKITSSSRARSYMQLVSGACCGSLTASDWRNQWSSTLPLPEL